MSKTLVVNKAGELARIREQIAEQIEGAWSKLNGSMEQIRRRWYHKLGENFLYLRETFEEEANGQRAKSRSAFVAYCKKRFPAIGAASRDHYMAYRLKLGPIEKLDLSSTFPPLKQIAASRENKRRVKKLRKQSEYGRIVDEEVDPADYEGPITKREAENELVFELAEKIISAGFRVLSVKLHPDRDGGSNEAQKRLSAAKKLLEDALAREELRR